MHQLLAWLALPEFGLSTIFVVAFVSATLLPLGSEPAVFGLIKLNPELFWPAILVATAGNTLGGMLTWWMGHGAHQALDRWRHSRVHLRALGWLERQGRAAARWNERAADWCIHKVLMLAKLPALFLDLGRARMKHWPDEADAGIPLASS